MKLFPGIKEGVYLNQFNTTGVGGPARYFYQAKTRQNLLAVLDWAEEHQIHFVVIGHGSNLIAPDTGFAGLVVRNDVTGYSVEEVTAEQALVTVEAGQPLLSLINSLAKEGWGGFENLAGIPGTVGGAVWGNAGCYGITTAEVLVSALARKEGGKLESIAVEDLQYRYRRSMLKEHPYWVVIAATYRLKRNNPAKISNQIRYILNRRMEEKPIGRSCGSFFKNPNEQSSAGYLIDMAGMKGFRLGDVRVSSQHANYLINDGQGNCGDILKLATEIKEKVYTKFRIALEEEVVLLADKPDKEHNREDLSKQKQIRVKNK